MDWKLALVQHPMYFLIREDSQCAERTPPWGEPSIELYCARVAQNLESLRQHPGVRIGYEWSGLELELLAKDASEVFRDMCALAREGRGARVGIGTLNLVPSNVEHPTSNIQHRTLNFERSG